MKKGLIWIVIIVFTVSFIFIGVACKEGAEPTEEETTEEKPFEGITLRYIASNDRPQYALQAIVPEFEEMTGIKVEMELLGIEEEMQKTRLEGSKQSDNYDIWVIPTFDNAVYFKNGWVANLDELAEKTGISLELDQFLPGVLEKAGQMDGTTYAVPIQFAYGNPVEYRKDLMEDPNEKEAFEEKYGYPLEPPKTWDQFYDIAEFFTRDTDNDGETDFWGVSLPLDQYAACYNTWLPLYYTSEGLDEGEAKYVYLFTEKLEPIFNGPQGVRAIEYLKDLYDNGYLAPGALTTGWGNVSEAIMAKQCFMTYFWAETLEPAFDPEISEISDLVWWSEQPIWEVKRMQYGAWMLSVNNFSSNKEAAFQFLAWAVSPEAEAKQIRTGLGDKIPMRTENFNDSSLMKDYYEIPKNMIENYEVCPELFLPEIDIVLQHLNEELQKIMVGEKTAQEGLDDAAAGIVEDFEEVGVYDRIE